MTQFSPREELEYVLRYWWLIALLAILGGAAGWLVHELRPPVYEARSVITLSIDFPEGYQLTQFEEDHAVNVAAAVIASTPVLERAASEAQAQGIVIDAPALWSKTTLERRLASWSLIIRDPDPQTAAALANLFARQGLATLAEAHGHALQARSLQLYLESLQACLPSTGTPEAAAGEGSSSDLCSQMSSQGIADELRAANESLHQEMLASQGVLPYTVFNLSQEATPPESPAQFGRNTLVLAGGMIGFILGVIAVNLRLPQRITEFRGK